MIKLDLENPVKPTKSEVSDDRPVMVSAVSELKTFTPKHDWVMFFIGALLGVFVGHFASNLPQRDDKQEQHQEQREQRDKPISLEGVTLVFISELNNKPLDQELLLRELPDWTKRHNCEFRSLDRDLPSVQPYHEAAEKAGVSGDFVAVVKAKKIIRVIPFPKDLVALEAKFK